MRPLSTSFIVFGGHLAPLDEAKLTRRESSSKRHYLRCQGDRRAGHCCLRRAKRVLCEREEKNVFEVSDTNGRRSLSRDLECLWGKSWLTLGATGQVTKSHLSLGVRWSLKTSLSQFTGESRILENVAFVCKSHFACACTVHTSREKRRLASSVGLLKKLSPLITKFPWCISNLSLKILFDLRAWIELQFLGSW